MAEGLPIDRQYLLELAAALDVSTTRIRRDEAGWWVIKCPNGYIAKFSDRPHDFLLVCGGRSKRHWSAIKKRLSFCQVTQDGDEEGCLRLRMLPSPEQAQALRKSFSLPMRPTYSAEVLERKKASMAKASAARGAAKTARQVSKTIPARGAGKATQNGAMVEEELE